MNDALQIGDWNKAATLLEQAVRAGNRDPAAAYLLAMCHKRLGRHAEALGALARIAEPDANVHLQKGLLAYAEQDFAQAETDFAKAWDLEPTSYAAGYNLLLARLCLKKRAESAALATQLVLLAPTAEERRFLSLLQAPLATGGAASADVQSAVAAMSVDDEVRLIDMLVGLGQFEVAFPLLQFLVHLRPHSVSAYQAYYRAVLVQGKELVARNAWKEASTLLAPLVRPAQHADAVDPYWRIALLGMLGTCSCMVQDYERGAEHFRTALEVFRKESQAAGKTPRRKKQFGAQGIFQEAWLEQNLALAYEWMGRLDKAESHWNRYFDYLEYDVDNARPDSQRQSLAFEGLSRLAELFTRKEKWHTALGFLQRAHKIKPTDPDVLERLFHLYDQLRKPEEARKILRRLREMRPNDPQLELFDLDVRDVRDVDDLDRFLADLRRLMQKNAGNMQVEERAAAMVAHVLPTMERLFDQAASQVTRVLEQMRRLPSYQINWPVVREVMRDLEDKFLALRKAASKSQSLARPDARRDLQRLVTQCDRKIEQCHSLGE